MKEDDNILNNIDIFDECAKAIFDMSEDIIFILNNQGQFEKVNNLGAIALDYTSEELYKKSFIDIVDDDEKDNILLIFSNLIKTKKPVSFKVKFTTKSGKTPIYEIDIKPIITNNEIAGIVGTGKNITLKYRYESSITEYKNKLIEAERLLDIERSRNKEEESVLDELNRLKTKFISGISHELRTPLTSIIGFSETILSDPGMSDDVKNEFNKVILNEGKRLSKLINDILDISRFESGKILINKTEFDIVGLIKEVIDINSSYVDNDKIKFNITLPKEEVLISADKDSILQVINGLITNAIKFSNEEGLVTIIAINRLKEFELIISDTGGGIPEEQLPYLFENGQKTEKRMNYNGAGIGLSIIKNIIDLHKGLILVRSEINKGTTFKIKLPKF